MKVVVREAARRDLDDIFNWISKDSPRAANIVVERIVLRVNRLATPGLASIGRPGLVEGTRELIEPPYIIVYRIDIAANELIVLNIVHGARKRDG
ncbi:type II toxin-antitoxin system RelE/ParE family toxin [Rhodopseudomonas palustris]|uniref:Type II toxin-antitoxin system RelE/ParE family toxin n=1 Tax=Rhodopseudomonas palustris TaxID=1076 RepID=A0A418VKG5_RHOPL|nr:type II toxin-antitoxin system RelE/ParE family toxin [Rhodopseudomonas palustris]RJF76647.1 type II toxin-antitoxin system RelE/ParE family toxin [Rhodopseudomonas palustris]